MPAMCNIEAATMTVTVAIEEARRRGMMSRRDLNYMTPPERTAYVSLCNKEWGVREWEPENNE